MTAPGRHWRGMTLRDQLNEWRERALEAEAERDRMTTPAPGAESVVDWHAMWLGEREHRDRLANVFLAARQHLRDGEGHLAMQVLDQVWAELIDGSQRGDG